MKVNSRFDSESDIGYFDSKEKKLVLQMKEVAGPKNHSKVINYSERPQCTRAINAFYVCLIKILMTLRYWEVIQSICDSITFTFYDGCESGVLCLLLESKSLSNEDLSMLLTNVPSVAKGDSGVSIFYTYKRVQLLPAVLRANPLAIDRKFCRYSNHAHEHIYYDSYVQYYFMNRSIQLTRGKTHYPVVRIIAVFLARQWRCISEVARTLGLLVGDEKVLLSNVLPFISNPGYTLIKDSDDNYGAKSFNATNLFGLVNSNFKNETDHNISKFVHCLLDFVPGSVLLKEDKHGRSILSVMKDLEEVSGNKSSLDPNISLVNL